jgi:uncharacterized protein DUF1843
MTLIAYGAAINDAIKKKSSIGELVALREHATAVVNAQGDLKGALKKLNAEIAKRQKAAKK